MVTLRFAPSPTGRLHVGNIRTALLNKLFALKQDGKFILRIDDTDAERSAAEYETAIFDDLALLGLQHDETFNQSDRTDRYNAVRDLLITQGSLYPCFETPEELEMKRKRQLSKRQPPVYDRAALELTDEEIQAFIDSGKQAHWRFLLPDEEIVFQDQIKGEVKINPATLSDPVLIRADGAYLYTLCSIIDDGDYGVTHIIRGEDHITNTAVQVCLFETLGFPIPSFAHHSLLTDENGEKLSKRIGSLTVRALTQEEGFEPAAILSYLARLGTSQPLEAKNTLQELAEDFDLKNFSGSAVRFTPAEMLNVNRHLIAQKEFPEIESRLNDLAPGADAAFWNVVRRNITLFKDIADWAKILLQDPAPVVDPEDAEYIAQAAERLPEFKPSEGGEVWSVWTQDLKNHTGRKGKTLFMPLRKALTGEEHGPEMAVIVDYLGSEKIKSRLRKACGK